MNKELPSLKSTDKELENIYDSHSNRFFNWLQTNTISPNSSRDIAMLAHNELVKRSNNRFSRKSEILTYSVIALSVITLSFAFLDFLGDKDWQEQQLSELKALNVNFQKQNLKIDSLKSELKIAENRIKVLEKSKENSSN